MAAGVHARRSLLLTAVTAADRVLARARRGPPLGGPLLLPVWSLAGLGACPF